MALNQRRDLAILPRVEGLRQTQNFTSKTDISGQRKVEMTESEKNAEIVRLRERCALLESLLGEGIRHHYFNEPVCFSVMAFGSASRGRVPLALSLEGYGREPFYSGLEVSNQSRSDE